MSDQLNLVFGALSDPTRRGILMRLAEGESQVSEIASGFEISPPAISRHLKVLEEAGLVTRRVEAQRRIICLDPEALRTASLWVDQYRHFWDGSLDRLEAMLAQDADDNRSNPKKDRSHEQTGKSRN